MSNHRNLGPGSWDTDSRSLYEFCDITKMALWEFDLLEHKFVWSYNRLSETGLPDLDPAWSLPYEPLLSADDRRRLRAMLDSACAKRQARFETEFKIHMPSGEECWVHWTAEIRYDDRRAVNAFGICQNVTSERRRAQAVEESGTTLEALMNYAPEGIMIVDYPGYIVRRVSRFASSIVREPLHEMEGRSLMEMGQIFAFSMMLADGKTQIAFEDQPAVKAAKWGYVVRDQQMVFRLADGTHKIISSNAGPIRDASGKVTGSVCSWNDVTEEKRWEANLRESEEKLRTAYMAGRMWSWEIDAETLKPRRTAPLLQNYVPVDPGNSFEDWLSRIYPEDRDRVQEAVHQSIHHNSDFALEFRMQWPDGTYRWVMARGSLVRYFDGSRRLTGIATDITQQKQTAEALRTSEKLATAGRMAASLAHEINNPLAAVTNLLYLLSQDHQMGEVSRHYLDLASAELARVGHITRNMLAFYRESTSEVEVSLSELVSSVVELYSPKLRQSRVAVEIERRDDATVLGYPGELRQVISNVLVNAIECMPGGGTVRLRTRTVGCRVLLTIADHGPGIAVRDRQRIFEPFFTTKGDKGTGLGLWVTLDIVSKHAGTIRVRSCRGEQRHGTCFQISLPVAARSDRALNESHAKIGE